jgi:hypothetical protein
MHHGGVDHHVVIEKLGRSRRIRENAADGARHQKHIFGPVGAEPIVHSALVPEVQWLPGRGQKVVETQPEAGAKRPWPTIGGAAASSEMRATGDDACSSTRDSHNCFVAASHRISLGRANPRATIGDAALFSRKAVPSRSAIWSTANPDPWHGDEYAVVRINGDEQCPVPPSEFRSRQRLALRAYFALLCS